MINKSRSVVLCGILLSTSAAWCDEGTVLGRLAKAASHLTVANVSSSPVPGIHEVEIAEDRARLYVTADGNHLFAGDLYVLSDDGLINLTEARRAAQRREVLADLKVTEMVVFPPTDGVKAVVYAFTDVDCPYCRQLHADVDQLNGYGIEVRYLAYPRGGAGTPTYDKMVSVWCAPDRQSAITAAKLGESVATATCDNPVADQFALGRSFYIGGTPALFSELGEMLSGYLPPDEIARRLGLL